MRSRCTYKKDMAWKHSYRKPNLCLQKPSEPANVHFSYHPLCLCISYVSVVSFHYRTNSGQGLFYCLKKVKWASPSCMCQLPCLSLLWWSVHPDQCSVGGRVSAAKAQELEGVGMGKVVCWRTKASGSVFTPPLPSPPFLLSGLTFRLPCHRVLLPKGRRWRWLWCCCLGNQEAWKPSCRGRSYGRRLGKSQQPSSDPHPAAPHAKPPAPQCRPAVHTQQFITMWTCSQLFQEQWNEIRFSFITCTQLTCSGSHKNMSELKPDQLPLF